MKRKQKGYALLLTMAIATMSLSITLLGYKENIVQDNERKQEALVTQTSKDVVDFSTAVTNLMNGVGAIPGESVGVSELKDAKLLTKGFNDTVAFNQKLKAYYVTNPDNKNVIDVLISMTGAPSESVMSQYGFKADSLPSFYSKIITESQKIGFKTDISENFYIGTISSNGKELNAVNGDDINISYVNTDTSKNTIGIYFEAPNQVGWWRFQFSPYMWQPSPKMDYLLDGEEPYLRAIFNATKFSEIVNGGFSYFCPSTFTKVGFNEEIDINKTDLQNYDSTNQAINVCVQTYKGSVVPEFDVPKAAQMFNPLKASDPAPVNGSPEVWNKCNIYTANYSEYPVTIEYRCAETSELKTMINQSQISGLDNDVVVDSYKMAQSKSAFRNAYNEKNKNKTDFNVPNVIFEQGFTRQIDNRFLRFYQMTGTFLTATSNQTYYDTSVHTINAISAVGVKISNSRPSSSASIVEDYTDKNGNKSNMRLTLPTPLIN